MSSLRSRLNALQQRIISAQVATSRQDNAVRLVAVSKTVPCDGILAAYRLGLREFAESYVQEALPKLRALGHCDITWHFIGPIQSNKSRLIAERFQWVHSVDRLKIAERLNEHRPCELPPLNVCLQVNVSGETTKAGVTLAELPALASAVGLLPRLRLRGLMTIPAPDQPFEAERAAFRAVRLALEALRDPGLDTLSMGMSDDLEAAIMEGATLVRVGSALFGARPAKPVALTASGRT
ncbi:MAG: YggS family pyridoxal phosphate-dependent enzyme [Gammaproteobacteria bacterium]|nr:YggS family pyridoxal phosphate-dependent enzyme [Gammaproteobacteria bacterium]